MSRSSSYSPLCLVAAALLAGCASTGQNLAGAGGAAPASTDSYQLTKRELGMDCATLTGHLKIRAMQVRDNATRSRTSYLARATNQAAAAINNASTRGTDPDAELARDRAHLDALNAQLAAKKCKTVDIDAELRGEPAKPAAASKTN